MVIRSPSHIWRMHDLFLPSSGWAKASQEILETHGGEDAFINIKWAQKLWYHFLAEFFMGQSVQKSLLALFLSLLELVELRGTRDCHSFLLVAVSVQVHDTNLWILCFRVRQGPCCCSVHVWGQNIRLVKCKRPYRTGWENIDKVRKGHFYTYFSWEPTGRTLK